MCGMENIARVELVGSFIVCFTFTKLHIIKVYNTTEVISHNPYLKKVTLQRLEKSTTQKSYLGQYVPELYQTTH